MSVLDIILGTLFPSLGVITSSLIYLSPLQAINKAIETRNASTLNPLVYAMMLVNGPIWMIYSFHLKNPFVFLANLASIPLASYYLIMAVSLQQDIKVIKRAAYVLMAGQSLVFLAAGISFIAMSEEGGKTLIGSVATIFVLLFIASPLSSLYQVITSQSIDPNLAIAQLVNAVLWLVYGMCINDPIVYAPNFIGITVAVAQLFLKRIYPDSTSTGAITVHTARVRSRKNLDAVEMDVSPSSAGSNESTGLLAMGAEQNA